MIDSRLPHNPISFSDILDANLLKRKYQEYEVSLRRKKAKELMIIVKDFLDFVKNLKSSVSSTWLMENLMEQEKVARRISLILKVRYFIVFLYKRIVEGLISRLINLMRSMLSQLSFI
ncbi:hypothetical protein [Metallosphaera hakonensis]|uniref:Uncharacterized protein n=1 Tax=Metallosphaera hakonensis JCM 8857 = DSM 7519 TaxID=1293036 RepID=A0A2U9IRT3_9CREN|nr:hypothetical protein [Metallosphaera hakonensis]AWR98726.1 hypothetical protein DFR87_02390 [Metallosphaera hakonensis JCM 8857 = DSM 7519]